MRLEPKQVLAILKAVFLLVFVACALLAIQFTPLGRYLTAESINGFLDAAGLWAPALFILIYGVGVCLFVPAVVFCTVGVLFFGVYWGFVYIWLGAMVGASLGFFMARNLGRDLVESLIGGAFKSYDDAIERNGFTAVLYVRLLYCPFTPANFGLGLTKVRFKEYFLATGIGIIMGTFLFVFLVGVLKDIWLLGDWSLMWSPKVLLGVSLAALSLSFPVILKRWSGSRVEAVALYSDGGCALEREPDGK